MTLLDNSSNLSYNETIEKAMLASEIPISEKQIIKIGVIPMTIMEEQIVAINEGKEAAMKTIEFRGRFVPLTPEALENMTAQAETVRFLLEGSVAVPIGDDVEFASPQELCKFVDDATVFMKAVEEKFDEFTTLVTEKKTKETAFAFPTFPLTE